MRRGVNSPLTLSNFFIMKTESLRAYLLEPGDRFIMHGVERKVKSKDSFHITYLSINKSGFYRPEKIGANSRQRVQLIVKHETPILNLDTGHD